MNEEILLYEVTDSVARLTLNRPKAMNSINLAILAELDRRLTDIAVDPEVRVLVLTGAGAAFCAGADLKEVLAGQTQAPAKPTFSTGPTACLAGCVTSQACHCGVERRHHGRRPGIGHVRRPGRSRRECHDRRRPCQLWRLSRCRRSGHPTAPYSAKHGPVFTADRQVPVVAEMQACGFVCEVHPDDGLADSVQQLAKHIARKSPIALRRMKEVARSSADKTRDDALLHEQVMLRQHMRTFDFREGLQAFAEKRAPQFQDR